jgi:hypothetical protein
MGHICLGYARDNVLKQFIITITLLGRVNGSRVEHDEPCELIKYVFNIYDGGSIVITCGSADPFEFRSI